MQIFAVLVIIVCIIIWIMISKIAKLKKMEAERVYKEALLGSDRRIALEAGRQYYSVLRRNGKLTIYDEQAITNDLSTMKTN